MFRGWRATPAEVRRPAIGLAAAGVTFLGQSLVEWMFRIPGLSTLGLLCLVLAAALVASGRSGSPGRPQRAPLRFGKLARGVLAGGLGGAIVLVLCLYLSDFYANQARSQAGRSPSAELRDARTAAALDPLSLRPRYLQASALESTGRRAAALSQLKDAERAESTNFAPIALIGDFYARGGQFSKARLYYRRALALDPLDSGLQQLARTGGAPSAG
jgi:hypothetical protein